MFGKHWTPAQAVVVDKRALKSSGDGMVTVYEYVVDVTTASGETFRVKAEEPRIAIDFVGPSIGQSVRVEYDPGSRKTRFDKDDPALSMKAYNKSREDHFEQSLAQPPGTPPGAGPSWGGPSAASPGMSPDVAQLAAMLHAQGAADQPQVVQLGSDSPEATALRDALLRAMGGRPVAEPPQQGGTTA